MMGTKMHYKLKARLLLTRQKNHLTEGKTNTANLYFTSSSCKNLQEFREYGIQIEGAKVEYAGQMTKRA